MNILDHLQREYPAHVSELNSLRQALSRAIGEAGDGSVFFDNFVDTNEGAVLVEADFFSEPLVLNVPQLGIFSISIGDESGLELETALVFNDVGAVWLLFDAPIFFKITNSDALTPVKKDGDRWREDIDRSDEGQGLSWVLRGVSLELSSTGAIEFTTDLTFDLPPVRIGASGVVVEMYGLRLFLSDSAQPPPGVSEGSRGFTIESLKIYLPEGIDGDFAPEEIVAEDLFLGNDGFHGRLSAEWSGGKAIRLGGMECELGSLFLAFQRNFLAESGLACVLQLPFFDEDVDLNVSFSGDGTLLASLSPEGPSGLVNLSKPGVFEIQLDSIRFEIVDGVSRVKLSGQLTPDFGKDGVLDWPTFDVRELSIDSEGNVHLDGGWLDLPKAYTLDLHGFKIEITKLGFGKTDDGGKYAAFSGAVELVKGIPAGASVEGARIIWYDDGRDPQFTLSGVGVEFSIPDKLDFKGEVSYENRGDLKAFTGDIELNLPAVNGLSLAGQIVFGSQKDPGTGKTFKYFAIYLEGEFDKAIPLWATGLGLTGIAGLFSVNYAPDRKGTLLWYSMDKSKSWYHQPPEGVIDLVRKWAPEPRSLGIGAGVMLSTLTDQGFKFHGKFLLLLLFPGPVLLIDGRANFLKKRVSLQEEAQFHALVVLDIRQGYFLIGIDAAWKADEKKGRLAAISGSAEAFFDFHDPGNWHFWLGKRTPREQRIRATIASLFQSQSYFMLDPKSLAVGCWTGLDKEYKWGPVEAAFEAWLDANALLSFDPAQFHADMWLHGRLAVRVFRFKLGICLDAKLAVELFRPFHIVGTLEITIDTPLKDFEVRVKLEWGPRPDRPEIPKPFRAAGIAHPKTTAQWALPAPAPGVPVDSRPFLTFRHPVNDHTGIAVNPAPDPGPMIIGDPAKGEGSARVFYDLEAVSLQRRDEHGDWSDIARRPADSGIEYERELFGSWAPFPPSSGTGGAAAGQTQLMIWSKNPLDHTDNGNAWNHWIEDHLPGYPCPTVEPRKICVDFLDHAVRSEIHSPWSHPDQPQIKVRWDGDRPGVVLPIRFPVDGVAAGLGFKADWPLAVGPFAYLADERAGVVEVLDLGRRSLVSPPIEVGGRPFAVTLTPDDSHCLVADDASATVKVIDTSTHTFVGQPIEVGAHPREIVVTEDGAKAYVSSGSTKSLTVLDVRRRRRIGSIDLVDSAQGMAILPGSLLVVHPTSSRLSVIDLGSDTVRGEPISVPGNPRAVAAAQPSTDSLLKRFVIFIYLPGSTSNEVVVVDLQTGILVGEPIPVGDFPTSAAVTPDQRMLYVANGRDATISVIDTATAKVVATLNVGEFPSDVTFTADGSKALVTNANDGTLSVIDVASNTVEASAIPAGARPLAGAMTTRPIDVSRWPQPPIRPDIPRVVIDLPPGVFRAEVLFSANPATPRGSVEPTEGTTVELRGEALHFSMSPSESGHQLVLEADEGWILLRVCATLPTPTDVQEQIDAAAEQIERSIELWRRPGEVLDPGTDYRLQAKIRRQVEGLGKLGGWESTDDLWLTEELPTGIFHTTDPPGLGKLTKPRGAEKGATGLEDLTPYVEQTIPATIPAKGERPWLPRPVYRAYDVGVLFGESYVASMYARARRDLAIYLFDQNDQPVRDAEGNLVVHHDPWGEADTAQLGDTDLRWQALLEAAACVSTPLDADSVPRRQTLTAGSRRQVLAADSVYEARLKPLLVREDFQPSAGWTSAPGAAPVTIGLRSEPDEPMKWTDYRISCRFRPAAQGRTGVVFRYQEAQRFYAFVVEPERRRRDLALFDGGYHLLEERSRSGKPSPARSGFVYRPDRSYHLVVEAVGPRLRILQDGELVFDVEDVTLATGNVGLFPWPEAENRFSELRVDDLRDRAPVAFRFQFTTSRYANFYHQLHSFQDECWAGNLPDAFDLATAAGEAVETPGELPADAEARAFDNLAEAVLGPAARQPVARLEVTRVEQGRSARGFLVRSPEPIDWRRTEVVADHADGELGDPSPAQRIKLSEMTFGKLEPNKESVTLLLRRASDLSRHRVEVQRLPEPVEVPVGDAVHLLATFETASAFESWDFYDPPGSADPGAWDLDGDAMVQTAPAGTGKAPGLPGPHAVTGEMEWRDYRLEVRLRTDNSSVIGVLFRYVDEDNYYRLSFDADIGLHRLVKRESGVFSVLWDDHQDFEAGEAVTVTVEAIGPRLTGYLGAEKLFALEDRSHEKGRVGCYSWRNPGARFEQVEVRRPTLEAIALFGDHFADGDLSEWLLLDEISGVPTDQTSRWKVEKGSLELESVIADGDEPAYLGTLAAVRNGSWGDVILDLRLRSSHGGAVGAVIRGVGLGDYYRFSMDSRKRYRRLVKKKDGVFTVLWQDDVAYDRSRWHRLTLSASGSTLRGYLDGVLAFAVDDAAHSTGNVALYCWNNRAEFRDMRLFAQRHAFQDWLLDESFESQVSEDWHFVDSTGEPTPTWPTIDAELGPPDGRWAALDEGTDDLVLTAVADGDRVYFGGLFTTAGSVAAQGIACWEDDRWSTLGDGVDGPVGAIAIDGDEVFVGGRFTRAGGVPARNLAVWNLSAATWSPLGDGVDGDVRALAVDGDYVFAGGKFSEAGGVAASRIARWQRSTAEWSPLAEGVDGDVLAIALRRHDDVFVGGRFTHAGGTPAAYGAHWDGGRWTSARDPLDGPVRAIAVTESEVFVGGEFSRAGDRELGHVAHLQGARWSHLSRGLDDTVHALAIVGDTLFAGGKFRSADGRLCRRTARWHARSKRWREVGGGADDTVRALASAPSVLHAAGSFLRAGNDDVGRVARLDLAERLDAVVGEKGWSDYRITARWIPGTSGASGLVFRYSDPDHHYRLAVDPAAGYLRLTKKVAGNSTHLGQVPFTASAGRELVMTMECLEDRLTFYLDATELASIETKDLRSGRVGFWSAVEADATFRELRVAPLLWHPYFTFGSERSMPSGTRLRIHSGHKDTPSVEQPSRPDPLVRRRFAATLEERGRLRLAPSGVRLRLVAPNGSIEHQRNFVGEELFRPVATRVLRKADQTAFFILPSDLSALAPGLYRFHLTYHRDREGIRPVLSEAGERTEEEVILEVPWKLLQPA